MKNLLKYFLPVVLITFAKAQENNDIPIGTWRSHLNYEQARIIEKVGESIYCAASSGLFYFDLTDNSLNLISKLNGLSDVGVAAMAFDQVSETLALGYSNGNIDLIHGSEVLNVAQIKDADISESKNVNHISFNNDRVYFSTDFGVIVLEMDGGEVIEAYQNLGPQGEVVEVRSSVFSNNRIYLATSIGVLEGAVSPQINLQDFNNWNRFEGSFVDGLDLVSITSSNVEVLTTDGSKIYSFDEGNWVDIGFDNGGEEILKLRQQGDGILIVLVSGILNLDASGNISPLTAEQDISSRDAILLDGNVLWYADSNNGLTRRSNETVEHLVPNGTFPGTVGKLQFVEDKIVALPQSISSSYGSTNNNLGYSLFENGSWLTVQSEDLLGIDDISAISANMNYISSFGDGVLNQTEQVIYDETNSPLQLSGSQGSDVLVSGLVADELGNLWVANSSSTPLLKKGPDNSWESFSFGNLTTERPQNLKMNSLGQIWMRLSNSTSGGIIVFEPETEEFRFIRSSDGLPSSKVTDVEFSKDEEVWVGTENGLAFFPFSFGIVSDNSIEASQLVFENRLLFDGELISAIEVDGGNRKWIGTNDGLWLFEDNADRLIVNFNEENSPLFSNNILDLKIHPTTGELFIATDKGLLSFRTDATNGSTTHQNVRIFPNPVLPGYNGQVGISGLASDVNVKITSVSGRLVKELFAAGGSTAWDIADHNGVRAESGVYLVFSSSSDGKETFVGKIAVIN